ncbi:MAG: peptide-modifying radical SAM enzyme CbpB, partial [Candidatus Omnitrophota bacterium]
MKKLKISNNGASSKGAYFNTGNGFQLQPIDIKHKDYIGIVSADTAFWALVKKNQLGKICTDSSFLSEFRKKEKSFTDEMENLRFGLKPSAVYFNPTDRCNLNCSYCYIPERLRKNGKQMSFQKLSKALEILKSYFKTTLPKGQKPQIIFHGAEPMLNREVIFSVIDKFEDYFRFGIQTNGTLLDTQAIEFLTSRGISIGLSLDGHIAEVADQMRKTWSGKGVFPKVIEVMRRLKGYHNYSVICTITKGNVRSLRKMVDFLHKIEAPVCILNPVRCTLPGGREAKPEDHEIAKYYLSALDRTYELYKKTGRRLVVANFANILLSILAPTARRLMCDISPCGGGRCFFAVSARGDLFPCSEFIGLKKFKGGNLFQNDIKNILKTEAFKLVTSRKV